MDDFGFGEDPDAEYFSRAPQIPESFEDDEAVLADIERDLGKSYVSERVTPAKHKQFNSFHGQSLPSANTNMIDEEEEKQIEILSNDLFNEEMNQNQPLKRHRKRKRSNGNDEVSEIPKAKRLKSSVLFANDHDVKEEQEDISTIDACSMYLHGRPSTIENASVPITNISDGECLYLHYESRNQYKQSLRQSIKSNNENLRSLSCLGLMHDNKSIDDLLDEVQNERISREIREMNANYLDLDRNDQNSKECDLIQTQLWTDKYAPKAIMDLLSSEKINREVTSWIKEWDYLVFGHKYRRHQQQQQQSDESNENKKKKKVYSVRNNMPMFGREVSNKNEHKFVQKVKKGRPEVSVLLFCGPPGTGKSTLAHIVANHCGYRPFEINASDERTGKKLKDVIINAATMKPMFGDTRPPLIICDEIDGGDASAISVILSIVNDANKHYAKKKKTSNKKQANKKKKNVKIVNRPIICICNNEYSKALRPLRQIAKIYKFKSITTRTLCKRLLDICRKEYIHTDLTTLSHLSSITNNDIRACLHTLQFFKQRGKGGKRLSTRLTVNALTNVPIGRKDRTQNIFDVWNAILKKKEKKKTFKFMKNKRKKGENEEWKDIRSKFYGMMSNSSKILEGVTANYLKLGYTDPVFEVTQKSAEWIMNFDSLKEVIDNKQHFFLMGYIPYFMIGLHETCAIDTFQRLEYPSIEYKNKMRRQENENIINNFLHSEADSSKAFKKKEAANNDEVSFDVCQYASILSRYFDLRSCVLELVPFIPHIVFTTKRWNNNDFNTNGGGDNNPYNNNYKNKFPSNKRHFVSIINTMIECGLNYVKKDKSSSFLELQPPIDRLSKFSFTDDTFRKFAQFKETNQWLRSKIAHQIVLEIMRRNEAGSHKYRKHGAIMDNDDDNKEEDEDGMRKSTMTPFMSCKKNKTFSRLQNKELLTPVGGGQFGAHKPAQMLSQSQSQSNRPTPAKFKNFITARSRNTKIEKYEYPILFKYVEGYTNAVKRKSFCRDWC